MMCYFPWLLELVGDQGLLAGSYGTRSTRGALLCALFFNAQGSSLRKAVFQAWLFVGKEQGSERGKVARPAA